MMIGNSFRDELDDAGLAGAVLGWREDSVMFSQSATEEQKNAVIALIASHDPGKESRAKAEVRKRARLERLAFLVAVGLLDAAIELLPDGAEKNRLIALRAEVRQLRQELNDGD